jgi:CspA family cold shock protein
VKNLCIVWVTLHHNHKNGAEFAFRLEDGARTPVDTPVVDAPETVEGAIRVRGRVKWFSQEKGFGFIVSDALDGDILIHRTVIHDYGATQILEGAAVECDVVRKIKGLQAKRLLSLDNNAGTPIMRAHHDGLNGHSNGHSNGNGARRQLRPREIMIDEPIGPARIAVCKWFSRPKGYGFVTDGGESDIFCHMDVMRRFNIRELRQGQRVLVRVGRGPKGLTATEIHLAPDLPMLAEHHQADHLQPA